LQALEFEQLSDLLGKRKGDALSAQCRLARPRLASSSADGRLLDPMTAQDLIEERPVTNDLPVVLPEVAPL